MKKLLIAIIATFLISFSTSNSFAQRKKSNKNYHKQFCAKLNLTDSQEAKFEEFKFNEEEAMINLQTNLKKNRLEMKKLFAGKNVNETQVMNLIDKASNLRAQLHKLKIKTWFSINNILDDNQKEIWKKKFFRMLNPMGHKHRARRNLSQRNFQD
ncbi:MAG: hypothetical protein CR986_10280 [Ignavibacteriae bacterium]|nr:MAG: hypothetical protein CR986_10280 [Ignavibacteriota bacterium]